MAIGAKLKQILEDRGLKAADIAAQTGLPVQTIYSLISRDSNKASIDNLIKICGALGITVEEFNQYDLKTKNNTMLKIAVTEHENKVITAYRDNPDMQVAVDKLLDVESAPRRKIDISAYKQNIAAGTGEEGFTPKKFKEVDDFARQIAELEANESD